MSFFPRDKAHPDNPAGQERLEQELQAARLELERKNRLHHQINHDLRTPLNSLLLQMQLIKMSIARLDQESEHVQALTESLASMKSSLQSMTDLLNRFVEMDRPETPEAGRDSQPSA
jgi:signal transduction histidine kinase